jgi:hypothetical protein
VQQTPDSAIESPMPEGPRKAAEVDAKPPFAPYRKAARTVPVCLHQTGEHGAETIRLCAGIHQPT